MSKTKKATEFRPNDFVVYPAHGVGRIISIDEQEVAGLRLEMFVISFEKDKMTLRVPISKATSVGMRPLSSADIVERALEKYGPPIYVRHEIVHNRHVVERLRAKGARFVDELSEIPPGSVTIFSAHGVSRAVESAAQAPSSTTEAFARSLEAVRSCSKPMKIAARCPSARIGPLTQSMASATPVMTASSDC